MTDKGRIPWNMFDLANDEAARKVFVDDARQYSREIKAKIPKLPVIHHYRIVLRGHKAVIRFGEGKASEFSASHLRVELEKDLSEEKRCIYETALNMLTRKEK